MGVQSARCAAGCGKIRMWAAVAVAVAVGAGACAETGGGGEGAGPSGVRSAVAAVREEVRPELARHIAAWGAEGVFVMYDEARDLSIRSDAEEARRRVVPASTFKIPNALIALETAVVSDEREVIAWDGEVRTVEAWNRDHTLASAFKASAVWFYQEVARRVGEERMAEWVERLGFGNADISGGIDRFWLDGGLRISADEQVTFLRRLNRGELPVSARSVGIVREMMRMEQTETYTLRGKTGWAPLAGVHHGWLVGWVEKPDGIRYFALRVEARERDFPMIEARPAIVRAIMDELGVM